MILHRTRFILHEAVKGWQFWRNGAVPFTQCFNIFVFAPAKYMLADWLLDWTCSEKRKNEIRRYRHHQIVKELKARLKEHPHG